MQPNETAAINGRSEISVTPRTAALSPVDRLPEYGVTGVFCAILLGLIAIQWRQSIKERAECAATIKEMRQELKEHRDRTEERFLEIVDDLKELAKVQGDRIARTESQITRKG